MKKDHGQVRSFTCAFKGIGRTIRSEAHMRVHLVFAVIALFACWFLQVEAWGWVAVILCIGMVFSAETFNTAVEALSDKVCSEEHRLIEIAKDAAAGAVLICAIASVVVGLIVYVPAAVELFF